MEIDIEEFRHALLDFARQLKASAGKPTRKNVALSRKLIKQLGPDSEPIQVSNGSDGTREKLQMLREEFPWRSEIAANKAVKDLTTIPEENRLRLAHLWQSLGETERLKVGPHKLSGAEAKKKFLTLAREIIACIKKPRSERWWIPVEQLTWTLEAIRLDLPPFEDWKIHLSDWEFLHPFIGECAALLIVTRTQSEDSPHIALGYPQLQKLAPESGIDSVVTMVYSDPYKRVSEGSRHLMHVLKDGSQTIFSGQQEARADAVNCLESWTRVIESMEISEERSAKTRQSTELCDSDTEQPDNDAWSTGRSRADWFTLRKMTKDQWDGMREANDTRIRPVQGKKRIWQFRKSLCVEYGFNCPEFANK